MNQLMESIGGVINIGLVVGVLGVLAWKFRGPLAGWVSLPDWLSPKNGTDETASLIKQLKILSLDLKEEQRDECLKAADVIELRLCKKSHQGCPVRGACLTNRN